MTSVNPIQPGGTYNIIQTVFKLSMMTNAANDITKQSAAYIQAQLAASIDAGMKTAAAQIGPWTRVWGPVVFQYQNSGVSDNAMYAAYNSVANCLVVGVAATNTHSNYDINELDLNVGSVTPFPLGITAQHSTQPASKNVGNVSAGAALGVANLLNMQDPATNKSLQTFLNDQAGLAPTVIFTGHSLGGSLSPTLAAWLYPSVPSGRAIYAVPTAGPSTGDQGFCNNFASVFPPATISGVTAPYGVVNQIIWNAYDCVPHAWTNIMNAQPYSPPNDIVWNPTTKGGVVVSCQSVYQQLTNTLLHKTAENVYGEVSKIYGYAKGQAYVKSNNFMFTPPSQPGGITSFQDFMSTVGQQHVPEYATYFGVSLSSDEAQAGPAMFAGLSEQEG